ncbi:hypothetical protein [Mumia quercus]|uniref:hypothetical protein n=1 Tax=Mumia quercus TaxID=2976125 RepID=UPI0021D06997|nr:hypothetical protein [Mumia quercus]
MKTLIKRASAAVAGGALAFSGLAVVSAAPAAAASSPIDVTSLRVGSSSGVAMNYGTKYMQVGTYMRQVGDLGEYGRVTVYADVYRGGTRLLANQQIGYVSSGYQSTSGGFTFYNQWGRGTFRVANVRIKWYDGSTDRWFTDTTVGGGNFTIKSDLRASGSIRYWSNSTRKVAKINLKRFKTNGKWGPYKTKVVLQRKAGGKWKKVKTLKLNRKGKVSYSFRSSKRYKYRFVVKGTSTTVAGKFTTRGKS